MEPRMLQLLLVLHVLALPVQLCEIPKGKSPLIRCLNTELLRQSQDLLVEPNPSMYAALRLSADHSLEKEARYLQRLKDVFLPSVSSSMAVDQQKQPSTGRLALYLLALRAACQDMETRQGRKLVTQLKGHLHKEKMQIAFKGKGHPITSYYQYSLGVLALCVHGKKLETDVIRQLLNAEKHNKFTHGGKLSVDTEAMVGLAFACLERANLYEPSTVAAIHTAGRRVTKKILRAQTAKGTFGNVFSSPLAVQLLIATRMGTEPECTKVMAALLESLEAFQNPMTMSQLLPVLYGKSYLDIATMECQAENDTLELDTTCPGPGPLILGPEMITVHLDVENSLRPERPEKLYNCSIQVPSGSSLLDVLRTAEQGSPGQFTEASIVTQTQCNISPDGGTRPCHLTPPKASASGGFCCCQHPKDPQLGLSPGWCGKFPSRFETQDTLQGLFLTSVMGVKAGDGEWKYWQLLQAPDTSLEKGISDYHPRDGETILLKFRAW